MIRSVEALKIRWTVALLWRRRETMAGAIRGFQATEADGVWHLHRGLRRLTDPRERAIVFTHSLEEESHAELFAHAYKHYGEHALTPVSYEREELYGPAEPVWKAFAFVHVGEEDATERFRQLRAALGPGLLKDTITSVVADEETHVDLTHDMLVRLGARDREIRSTVLRVRLQRAWEAWLRNGRRIVDLVASFLLSVAYFALGPFFYASARRRLASRTVEYDNNRLKRL